MDVMGELDFERFELETRFEGIFYITSYAEWYHMPELLHWSLPYLEMTSQM